MRTSDYGNYRFSSFRGSLRDSAEIYVLIKFLVMFSDIDLITIYKTQ